MQEIESKRYYGAGYEDVQHRRPSIKNAKRLLKWTPKMGMAPSVAGTLDYFLRQSIHGGPQAAADGANKTLNRDATDSGTRHKTSQCGSSSRSLSTS